jgi:murein DD-endopeptidase MepM/ murein hydrolase activator NlpD
LPSTDWGLARLATHALVLGLALAGAALGPLELGQQPAALMPAQAHAGGPSNAELPAGGADAPASVRPDSATMHGALTLSPVVTTADLRENLHHLARFIWPTQGTITTYFSEYHPGVDIANAEGTPEVAADAGRVVFAGWGSYGLYVEIDHGNGFHTVYGHMSSLGVQDGDVVLPGQRIGLMGSTGRSTGPHLHFEIRYQGAPQNPLDFLG